MKKRITLLVSLVLGAGSFAFAQEPYPYEDFETVDVYNTAKDAKGEGEYIEIDGLENEDSWANAVETPIAKVLHDMGVDPVPNTGDVAIAATYKVVRDVNYLYFFVKVKDATYVPFAPEMTGDTNIDNIELMFFPNPEDKDLVNSNLDARPRGQSQLRASVGNTENRATGGGYALTLAFDGQIPGYEYKTVQTADGYNMEIIVPLDIIVSDEYVGNLEKGKKILFDINVANCTDYTSGRAIILGWSGDDFQGWRWNPKLGDMVFMGDVASIESNNVSNVNYVFVDGKLQLSGVENNTKVAVYNISGQLVQSVVYTGQDIDLGALAGGVYAVQIQNAGVLKIVK